MSAVVHEARYHRWPLLFCPGSSFRSRLSLGGGTGNGPMISLRPSLITEHHSVSGLNDLAPSLALRSAQVGLGMANGQPRALGSECWFGVRTLPAKTHLLRRKRASDRCSPTTVTSRRGASVDQTEARCAESDVRRLGRSGRPTRRACSASATTRSRSHSLEDTRP